jgi:hypothetical protein
MSETRPEDRTGPRLTRDVKKRIDAETDICEDLLAELQARRRRLQELLSLVIKEAERTPPRPIKLTAARTHSKRTRGTLRHLA